MSGHTAISKVPVQQCWLCRFGAVLISSTLLLVVSQPSLAQSLAAPVRGVNSDFPTFDEVDLAAAVSLDADEVSQTQMRFSSWRRRLRRQMEVMRQSVLSHDELSHMYASDRTSGGATMSSPALQMAAPSAQEAGIGQLLSEMPPLVSRIGIHYAPSLGALESIYGLETIFAIVKMQDRVLLGQSEFFVNEDGDFGSGLGLAYRQVFAEPDLLLGVNAFLDNMYSPSLHRISFGLEAKTSHASVYANLYNGIGGDDIVGGGKWETVDMWDVGVAMRIPTIPWLELAAQYYQRNFQVQDNANGQRYSLRIIPVPLISMAAIYDKQEQGEEDVGIAVDIGYRPGVPFSEQISPHRVKVEQARFRMLEPVRHDGRHIYERRPTTASQS